MQSHPHPSDSHSSSLHREATSSTAIASKQPQEVLDRVFAFPPNRDTLGGTAYFIVGNGENILIDSPALQPGLLEFIEQKGGLRWQFITHRTAIGQAKSLQQHFGGEIVIQQQEAYLIPETPVTTFDRNYSLTPEIECIWTPGHSPGSSCLYYRPWGLLFSGRHILPDVQGNPMALKHPKTFHWPRQLRSIQAILERFNPETLRYLCPGANTGFLRGERKIDRAYERLAEWFQGQTHDDSGE